MLRVRSVLEFISVCILLQLFSIGAFAQGQVSFFQTPTYAGTATVVGDFNLDGKLDIINSAGTVLLGKGDGTFTKGATLSNAPSFVADFNDDGKPDVLALTSSNHLLVYLGNGNGTFQPPQDTYAAVPLYSVAVADVNGDNKADVLVPNTAGGVLVFLGKGDGTFASPLNYSSPVPNQLFVGDFNNDGKPDVLVTIEGSVSVLLGNGDGTFQAPKTTTSSTLGYAQAVGDLNGDLKLDLIVSTTATTPQIATMLGNGDGTFQAPNNQFTPTVSNNPTLADINGDGKLDLLVQGLPFLQVYLGNDDGTFIAGREYSYNSVNLTDSGNILVGDFNDDHKLDITAAQSILFGNGDGTFQASPAILLPNGEVISAAVSGDFNGDGKSDMAVTSSTGTLYIYLGDAAGTLTLAHTYALAYFGNLQTGDFNGDGKLDLIASTSGAMPLLAVLLGNGDGSFGAPVESNACPATATGLPGGAIADLNGDHKSDLAVAKGDSLSICLANGDGTFASAVNYFFGSNPSSVVIADFNNDGKPDAAVGGGAGVAIFLGNGDGTFQGGNYPLTTLSSVGPTADFNLDGNADLIINGTVYLGSGKGAFKPLSQKTMGLGGSVVDLNGDGYPDLVDDSYTQQLVFFLGNGDGTFQAPVELELGEKYGSISEIGLIGDFNGDGRQDLAISWGPVGAQTGIQILLNTTPPPAPDFAIGPASGSSNSATITAGQTASFNLTIKPFGSFSGTVTLSCTITPAVTPAPVCTVPASVNVTPGTVAPVTVKVSTTAPGTAGSISSANFPRGAMPIIWTLVLLASGLLFAGYRRRIPVLAIPLIAVAFLGVPGCGGGTSSPTATPGTPAGTYTATITAKSGSLNHSTALTVMQ